MRDEYVGKLERYIASAQETVPADCARFAGGWVLEATGRDALAGLSWGTMEGGLDLIKSLGTTLPAIVSERLMPKPRTMVMLGDVVALPLGADAIWSPLGICAGVRSYFLIDMQHIGALKTSAIGYAWDLI